MIVTLNYDNGDASNVYIYACEFAALICESKGLQGNSNTKKYCPVWEPNTLKYLEEENPKK